jgi:hypothetical protein
MNAISQDGAKKFIIAKMRKRRSFFTRLAWVSLFSSIFMILICEFAHIPISGAIAPICVIVSSLSMVKSSLIDNEIDRALADDPR